MLMRKSKLETNKRDRLLIDQMMEYLDSLTPSDAVIKNLTLQGQTKMVLTGFHPPNTAGEGPNGLVPPEKSYFSGFGPNGLHDASKNGVPIVSLFQGYKVNGVLDPRGTLPHGLTVIDHLNARESRGKERTYSVYWVPSARMLEVHLDWSTSD